MSTLFAKPHPIEGAAALTSLLTSDDLTQNPDAPKYVIHLLQYPLVNDTKKAMVSTKFGASMANALKSSYKTTILWPGVKHVYRGIDHVADNSLSTLDVWFPNVKKVNVTDLTDPVIQPAGALKLILWKLVVEPTALHATNVKSGLDARLYDKNGKCVYLAVADPVVAPVNQLLDKSARRLFPAMSELSPNPSCELARTREIMVDFVTRKKAYVVDGMVVETNSPA